MERSPLPAGRRSASRRNTAPRRDLPLAENRHPWWPDLASAEGSISIGRTNAGRLVRGRRFPARGPHHRATPDQLARATWEGTDEIVSVVLVAAEALARARPGALLEVANIARRGGGPLPWSVSHQNGRDADLLFPLLDDGERPVLADEMVHLDAEGRGQLPDGRPVRLDVDGLLAVVRALVEQEEVPLRHLFISHPLREMVLARAEEILVPPRVLRRMKALLRQPRGTLPHDDHLHVRIGCAEDDVREGCRGARARKDGNGPQRSARTAEVLAVAREGSPAARAQAMRLLASLAPGDPAVAGMLTASLADRAEPVRLAALAALRGRAGRELDRALASRLKRRPQIAEVLAALEVIEARPDRRWPRSLRALLSDERALPQPRSPAPPRTIRGEAVWLAGVIGDLGIAETLERLAAVEGLEAEVERALRRIRVGSEAKNRRELRERLLELGLVDERGRVERRACLDALTSAPDEIRHAARRLLDTVHRRPCRCPRWSFEDLAYWWRRRLR